MGKLEELARLTANNVNDSIGVGRAARQVQLPTASASTPARWQGVSKAKNTVEIPVEKIDRDHDQPREEFDEEALARLADSIKARGLLQPIRVRWDEARGVYVVVVGERRWRASRMAGLSTISAVVMEGPLDPGELLAIQLVENAVREDLKPIEQAKAFRSLMDRNGWSARQVARELAIDHTGVARALALLTLPGDVQDAVESGQIAPRTAYELTKIDDAAEQAKAAQEAAAGRLTRDDLAERNRNPRKGRGAAKGKVRKITDRTFRTAIGHKVTIENRRGLDASSIRAALLDVLSQIDAELGTDDQAAA